MGIGVLLDLDNIKPRLDVIEEICIKHGQIVERRAFANTSAVLAAYGSSFRQFHYRFEITPGLDPVAQEVDTLIKKTALEWVENPNRYITSIAIVSNDNGYADLFRKLRKKNIKTIAIGNQLGLKLREIADFTEDLKDILKPFYIGIDLGTTNTVIAHANRSLSSNRWVANAVEVQLPNEQEALVSTSLIPSSVRFSIPNPEIGFHVRSQAFAHRNNTILAWKHDMGVSHESIPYCYSLDLNISEDVPSVLPTFLERYYNEHRVVPEEAAAVVLDFVRNELVKKFNNIQGVVITHPACYESDAIESTRRAAILAGWEENEVVLLPEPHSALFDFLERIQSGEIYSDFDFSEGKEYNIMVYDLGGGTLDVSLHRVNFNYNKNRFDINDIAIGSRTRIGGDVTDKTIAEYIINNIQSTDILTDAEKEELRYELEIYSEKYKKTWGLAYNTSKNKEKFSSTFKGVFLRGKMPIRNDINREKMCNILSDLLCFDLKLSLLQNLDTEDAFNHTPFVDRINTFIVPVLEILLKSKQNLGQIPKIDAVLLNGGMTYFPLIRERLEEFFEHKVKLLSDGNPELAVARGAALFSAGIQGAGAKRVNPTHIYIEAVKNNRNIIERIISQGQTYPYKTLLKNKCKLPDAQTGFLNFKIWVGMGNRPGINTILQRFRQVPIEKIRKSLQPNSILDLEVEYTFDERLILTLIDSKDENNRFKLEVSSEQEQGSPPPPPPPPIPSHMIPVIPRTRPGMQSNGKNFNINNFMRVIENIFIDPNSNKHQKNFREQLNEMSFSNNREQTAQAIYDKLSRITNFHDKRNIFFTTKYIQALCSIFLKTDSEKYNVELNFVGFISHMFNHVISMPTFSPKHLHGLQKFLIQEMAETPGKLLWNLKFDVLLKNAYNRYSEQGYAQTFLNSLGKCGEASKSNIDFLLNIMRESPQLSHREKASWALARLISPAQQDEFRYKNANISELIDFVFKQLTKNEEDPRVLISLIGCLYQLVLWYSTGRLFIDTESLYHKKVANLKIRDLASYDMLSSPKYLPIRSSVEERLRLLPKLLTFNKASEEDHKKIKEYLLEILKS